MRDRKVFSWAMYDWANSAFSTTVMAGFFPLFFKQYWSAGADAVVTTAKLGTTLSVSSLLIAILSPTLGVLADLRGAKKLFCALFMLVGAGACVWLSLIPYGGWAPAMVAYGLGMMAFAASAVFYDSLLPGIARGTKMDEASSLGYSLGYLGGGVLFTLNVLMYQKPEWFGISDPILAIRLSFASVALWWILFSLPMFFSVPEPNGRQHEKRGGLWDQTLKSISGLQGTFLELLRNKNLLIFVVAYWMYVDGVYTVMSMAVDFGLSIGLEASDLIAALLIVQYVGFPATLLFGKLTGRFGCRKPILFCIGVYAVTVVLATGMSQAWHFYLLATVIGLVQGGVQSLSRSLYAHMIPRERAGEFFGFFNLVGKFASIVGPLVVAVTVLITGNSRVGMTGLLLLFLGGGYLLLKVKEPRSGEGIAG